MRFRRLDCSSRRIRWNLLFPCLVLVFSYFVTPSFLQATDQVIPAASKRSSTQSETAQPEKMPPKPELTQTILPATDPVTIAAHTSPPQTKVNELEKKPTKTGTTQTMSAMSGRIGASVGGFNIQVFQLTSQLDGKFLIAQPKDN